MSKLAPMKTRIIITAIAALALVGCATGPYSGPRNAAAWGIISNGLGGASRAYLYNRPVTCYGPIGQPSPYGVGGGFINTTTCY